MSWLKTMRFPSPIVSHSLGALPSNLSSRLPKGWPVATAGALSKGPLIKLITCVPLYTYIAYIVNLTQTSDLLALLSICELNVFHALCSFAPARRHLHVKSGRHDTNYSIHHQLLANTLVCLLTHCFADKAYTIDFGRRMRVWFAKKQAVAPNATHNDLVADGSSGGP